MHLVIFRSLLLPGLVLASVSAVALDEDRLWLPRSYQKLYLDLKEAALAAEGLNRCVSVQDATIDLEQSTDNHPIYRILCTQQNGRTYSEMVDGLSFETLTTSKLVDAGPSEEELRIAEELRLRKEREAKIEKLWRICHAEFSKKTRLMNKLRAPAVETIPPVEELAENRFIYLFDFDAKDAAGTELYFSASCEIENPEKFAVTFSRRIRAE